MNCLQSCPPFDAPDGVASAAPFEDDNAEWMDNAEYRSRNFGPVTSSASVRIGSGRNHLHFAGGAIAGGTDSCQEIVGATDVYHEHTRYQRGTARSDVVITGGAARITWNGCPGLRWIVAGDYSELDRSRTGSPVRDCEVIRAPFEELTVVVCINSEPFRGDVVNLRLPWRWLHFRCVGIYFWICRATGARCKGGVRA